MPGTTPEEWVGERVTRWLERADGIDLQLRAVSDALFEAAALQPGERVLDVGCGTGPTTREAAAAVGSGGAVTGLDVTDEMLAAAAARTTAAVADGAAPIDWLQADPVTWAPPVGAFDVVLSRFGVMFFSDPGAAFTHLADATRPGGRLAVATWAPRSGSDVFQVPYAAALKALGRQDEQSDREGSFSLCDPAEVRELLEAAGWSDVRSAVLDLALPFAGGVDAATSAEHAVGVVPTRAVVAGLDDATRVRVLAAIAEALAPYEHDGAVVLRGTVLVTTAHRPPE
jgi:ubiquinone/menaquinone biosynthesis C-methylase UbiE